LVVAVVWSASIVWKMYAREQRSEKATKKATLEQAQHAGELRVVLLDVAHRRVDLAFRPTTS